MPDPADFTPPKCPNCPAHPALHVYKWIGTLKIYMLKCLNCKKVYEYETETSELTEFQRSNT